MIFRIKQKKKNIFLLSLPSLHFMKMGFFYYLQQSSSFIFNSFIYFLPISTVWAITHTQTYLSFLTFLVCISSPSALTLWGGRRFWKLCHVLLTWYAELCLKKKKVFFFLFTIEPGKGHVGKYFQTIDLCSLAIVIGSIRDASWHPNTILYFTGRLATLD